MSLAVSADQAIFFRRLAALAFSIICSLILHFFIILTGFRHLLRPVWRFVLLDMPAAISMYLHVWLEPVSARDIVRTRLGWAFVNSQGHSKFWNLYFGVYYVSFIYLELPSWLSGAMQLASIEKSAKTES